MKIEEVRGKTDAELEFELKGLEKDLFGMRFKMATDSSVSPSKIRRTRRTIARVKTVLHERRKAIRGQEPR